MYFFEFRKLVAEMRVNQKAYFKSRDKYYLLESQKLEKLIDSELSILNLNLDLNSNQIIQNELFE